eukprot:126990_1
MGMIRKGKPFYFNEKLLTLADKAIFDEKFVEFYTYHFKISECKLQHEHDEVRCPYHKSARDTRRCPVKFAYSATPCKFVNPTQRFNKASWGSPLKCRNKERCKFSHNIYEAWYHPNAFRTRRCPIYHRLIREAGTTTCAFAHHCPRVHDVSEQRDHHAALRDLQSRRAATTTTTRRPTADGVHKGFGQPATVQTVNSRTSPPYRNPDPASPRSYRGGGSNVPPRFRKGRASTPIQTSRSKHQPNTKSAPVKPPTQTTTVTDGGQVSQCSPNQTYQSVVATPEPSLVDMLTSAIQLVQRENAKKRELALDTHPRSHRSNSEFHRIVDEFEAKNDAELYQNFVGPLRQDLRNARKLKDALSTMLTCDHCKKGTVACVYVPCGHLACSDCVNEHPKAPGKHGGPGKCIKCRKRSDRVQDIYFS